MKHHHLLFNADSRIIRHHALGALALFSLLTFTVLGLLQVVKTEASGRNVDQVITNGTRFYTQGSQIQDLNSVRFDPCKKD